MSTIHQRKVLNVVLLRTLATDPNGMKIPAVNEAISEQYTFPEDWYREIPASQGYTTLRELGHDDWRVVPQATLIELVKTEPQWKNEIRWARNDLRKLGFLDPSAPFGVWRLTAEGLAAATSPQAHISLTDHEQEIATPKPRKPRTKPETAPSGPEPLMTERERLLAALAQLAGGLPVSELELLVDLARVVRRRNLTEDSPGD